MSNQSTRNETFTCNCRDGQTQVVSDDRVIHACGFRASANYGSLGVLIPYRRVQITGTDRFNWFTDYQSISK